MIRKAFLWVCLLSLANIGVAGADDAKDSFDFRSTLNISYADLKLDQKPDPSQTLDIYHLDNETLVPVILYVHGGGWAFGDKRDVHLKPHYYTMQGFGFVSMNYRLRWDYKIYDQLVDIVSAIRWITENGKEHGLDASKIILMGSDSGAHLASLVVADSSYLKVEGMDGSNIKAVVAIDTLSFDITRLMKELGSFLERRKHQLIFGADEKVWQAASPIHHVANSQTLPPFALLYNPEEEASTLQAKGFAKALSGAGVQVVMIAGSTDGAAKTDELIGTSGNVASGALMAFIRSLI